MKDNKQYVLLR